MKAQQDGCFLFLKSGCYLAFSLSLSVLVPFLLSSLAYHLPLFISFPLPVSLLIILYLPSRSPLAVISCCSLLFLYAALSSLSPFLSSACVCSPISLIYKNTQSLALVSSWSLSSSSLFLRLFPPPLSLSRLPSSRLQLSSISSFHIRQHR